VVYRTPYGSSLARSIEERGRGVQEKRYSTLLANRCLVCYTYAMKRISVNLTAQQIAALKAWSAATGIRFGELLRRIVDEAIDKHLAQVRDSRE
jgi:hypothetical protein